MISNVSGYCGCKGLSGDVELEAALGKKSSKTFLLEASPITAD